MLTTKPKTDSISTTAIHTKTKIYQSLHLKQVDFGPHTVNGDPPNKKQVTFDPNTENKSNRIPYAENK